jgi:drug/metabolite transporter (DMT)-like permease
MLLMICLFWGLSFPLMKAAGQLMERVVPDASTWFYTSMMLMPRFVLASVVLALLLGRGLRTITANEWKQGGMLGAFAVLV